jgi:hypothetical protein
MSKVGANALTHCSVSGKVAGGCFASAIPAERRAKIGPDWVRFAEHQKDRDFVSQNRKTAQIGFLFSNREKRTIMHKAFVSHGASADGDALVTGLPCFHLGLSTRLGRALF